MPGATHDPPPGVRLRAAVVADATAVGSLHVAAWRATYRGIFPDDVLDGLSEAVWAERHHKRLTHPNPPDSVLWVAEGPRGIAGFSAFGSTRDADLPPATGEVYAIYLLPEALGRGIGRALFAKSLALLAEQGKRAVIVWVAEANVRAIRFYERAGFALDPSVPAKPVVFQGRDFGVPEIRLRACPLPAAQGLP